MKGLFKLRNELIENGVIFSFSGKPSQAIVSSIAETFEEKMQKSNVKFSVVQNIFSVFVEQIQNVMSYSPEHNEEENSEFLLDFSIVAIGQDKNSDKYYVLSGNVVKIEEEMKIIEKINKVNSLEKSELRKYYKELRKSGVDSHDRGAGLGFIEMAKKATEPLEFTFEKMDEDFTFFTLKVII